MNRSLMIIAGYLAAGKTTFGLNLSRELNIPFFSKDLLKNTMDKSLPIHDRAESKRLSAAAFDVMAFAAEELMAAGMPLILEANFRMGENHNHLKEGDVLKALAERYGYRMLTYLFLGDPQVLYQRLIERDRRPGRGVANQIWEDISYDDFVETVRPLGEFDIGGERVKIDTTDLESIDFSRHIETARSFMDENRD